MEGKGGGKGGNLPGARLGKSAEAQWGGKGIFTRALDLGKYSMGSEEDKRGNIFYSDSKPEQGKKLLGTELGARMRARSVRLGKNCGKGGNRLRKGVIESQSREREGGVGIREETARTHSIKTIENTIKTNRLSYPPIPPWPSKKGRRDFQRQFKGPIGGWVGQTVSQILRGR